MKKKKLLITASTFPRWKDDSEPRFILDMAIALQEYYEVTVLVPWTQGALKYENIAGVEVYRYHYFPIHKWETLCYPGSIIGRIKEKKVRMFLIPCLLAALWYQLYTKLPYYDFVLANWIIPQGVVQTLFNKPYVIIGHGSDIMTLNGFLVRLWKKKCLKKASEFCVVSNSLKEKVKELNLGVVPKVVPMGFNENEFGPQYRINNFFEQNGKKVVLFVGRLVEIKGVSYLIEAMKNIDDAILVIVGDGPLKPKLMKQAEELEDRILFLGSKCHKELKAIYASADIFVMPSIVDSNGATEGFGLVMLEAMASGLPVIAFNTGGIAEIIQNEQNGLLVEEKNICALSNGIKRILTDYELRSNLIEHGFITLENMTYKKRARELYNIMEKV